MLLRLLRRTRNLLRARRTNRSRFTLPPFFMRRYGKSDDSLGKKNLPPWIYLHGDLVLHQLPFLRAICCAWREFTCIWRRFCRICAGICQAKPYELWIDYMRPGQLLPRRPPPLPALPCGPLFFRCWLELLQQLPGWYLFKHHNDSRMPAVHVRAGPLLPPCLPDPSRRGVPQRVLLFGGRCSAGALQRWHVL